MSSALPETGLVEVEVLVQPVSRVVDQGARRSIEIGECRIADALREPQCDVNFAPDKGCDLTFPIVLEGPEGHAVQASPATARDRRAGPVVVTHKLDRIVGNARVLERPERHRIDEVDGDWIRLPPPLPDRDVRQVVLRQDGAGDHAEPAGEGRLEVDVGLHAVGGDVDPVDLLPARVAMPLWAGSTTAVQVYFRSSKLNGSPSDHLRLGLIRTWTVKPVDGPSSTLTFPA